MADYEHLRVDSESGLVTIEIARPPHNVLDIAVMAELERAVEAASRHESTKALMITGAGEKAFSAGVDVADHTPDKVERMLDVFHGLIRQVMSFPIPTIAALNGSAMGGGCELALSCDMVLAKEGARVGQPEIKLGVFAPVAAILLPRIVPPAKAVELLLGGGLVTADEAKCLGLVNYVYPAASFAAECRAFAGQFTSLSRTALIHGKHAIRQASGKPFQEALLQLERLYLDELMATSDALEGLASFIEKRKPVWANC
jgi:cyclohexa-1,5-dienecarbonyl-CoA hydratase